RCAGLQSLDDPAVASSVTRLRDIGLQQDPRLELLLRRAFSFPQQRLKPFTFLAAQPHDIFLYRNLLAGHDRPRHSSHDPANHQILSKWLKRATSAMLAAASGL